MLACFYCWTTSARTFFSLIFFPLLCVRALSLQFICSHHTLCDKLRKPACRMSNSCNVWSHYQEPTLNFIFEVLSAYFVNSVCLNERVNSALGCTFLLVVEAIKLTNAVSIRLTSIECKTWKKTDAKGSASLAFIINNNSNLRNISGNVYVKVYACRPSSCLEKGCLHFLVLCAVIDEWTMRGCQISFQF